MEDATLMRFAILPPDERIVAVENLFEVLLRGELTVADVASWSAECTR